MQPVVAGRNNFPFRASASSTIICLFIIVLLFQIGQLTDQLKLTQYNIITNDMNVKSCFRTPNIFTVKYFDSNILSTTKY